MAGRDRLDHPNVADSSDVPKEPCETRSGLPTSESDAGDGSPIDRRTLLRVGAAATVGSVSPLSAQSVTADTDLPTLAYGFFNLRSDGQIVFTLIASRDLSADEKTAVVDALTTSAGNIVRADEAELAFFDRFGISADRLNELAGDAELTDRQRELMTNDEIPESLPWSAARTVRGRIEGAVDLPREQNRFAGQTTAFPKITYDGPTEDGQKRFAVQFHDGFVYQFPFQGEPYRSARYEIESGVVQKIPEDGDTLFAPDFDDLPGIGDSRLVPEFSHRAHPLLVTLRSLAFRRAVLLNVTAGRIARFDDVFTEEILKATGNAALKTIGTLAPTPPDPDDDDGDGSGEFTPAEITQSVVVGGLTIAGSVSGVALVASAAITLVGAVNAISEWGETVQEAASSIEDLQLLDLQVDGRCEPGNENPQCCQNVTTSIFDNTCGANEAGTTLLALAELSRFQAREATRALAAGEGRTWQRHRQGYVNINKEIVDQLDIIRNEIDEAKPQGLEDTKRLLEETNNLLRQEGTGRTDAGEIIDEISTRFRNPTAAVTLPDTETVVAGEPVTIEADASASPLTPGEIDSYEWSFDPQVTTLPEEASITGDPIEITFAEPDTYEVTLSVETTEGRTVTTTRQIDVTIGQVGLDTDAWPMAGGTPTHTSYAPQATPPTEDPGAVWTASVDGSLTTAPAIVGGRAYVGGEAADGGGVVVAVDAATGEEQWRAPTERPVRAAPAVVDGTVYVGDGGNGRGTVYAFEADSGEQEWTTGVGSTQGHVTATGTSVYVHAADQVVALAAGDGVVRWTRQPRGTDDYPPTVYGGPVVAADRVFSSVSGNFSGDLSTNDDPGVLAMAATDGTRHWRHDFGDETVGIADIPTGPPAVAAGTVYAGESLNRFYALTPETGEIRWEAGSFGSSTVGALNDIDPEAIAVTDGTVYAAGPASDSLASPSLVALDTEDGTNRWETGLNGGDNRGSAYDVLVAGDTVCVVDPSPRLRAIRAGDGSTRWRLDLDAGVRSLAAAGELVFATTTAGDLRAFGSAAASAPDVTGDGNPATDPDGDGLYEDVNGDGNVTPGDASVLFNRIFESDPAVTGNVSLFDFSGDGSLTPGDAAVLFEDVF